MRACQTSNGRKVGRCNQRFGAHLPALFRIGHGRLFLSVATMSNVANRTAAAPAKLRLGHRVDLHTMLLAPSDWRHSH